MQISSLYGHYLLIFMFIPAATKSCHLDVLWKQMAPTQYIELHVPLFTGKAGLGDNKKGDIYSSLRQCDVPCQITAQVGQGAPPCWEGGRDCVTEEKMRLKAFHIHIGTSIYIIVPKDIKQLVVMVCPLQRSLWPIICCFCLGFL